MLVTDNLAVTAGLEYVSPSWQDIEYSNGLTLSTTDSIFRFGVIHQEIIIL
jgi:hypothetical protein